jgi:dTDP-4-amino-4,6-dideoxygalactose transaminase
VVVTHLYGRLGNVEAVRELCEGRGIRVIEDCAQAIGARGPQGAAGTLGDIATFSFYPTKNLGALGDGGAVATMDGQLAERVRALSQYGWAGKYEVAMAGGRNSRLDELQAAILSYRLGLVDEGNIRRREIVSHYEAAAPSHVRVLPASGVDHVAHLAVVEVEDAKDLAAHLAASGVGSAVHYPIPDHRQPAYRDGSFDLPVTESKVGRVLSLPCFPELTDDEVGIVARGLATYREPPKGTPS